MASFFKVNPRVEGTAGSFVGRKMDYLELNMSNLTVGDKANIANVNPNYAYAKVLQVVEQFATIDVLGSLQTTGFQSILGTSANAGVRMLVSGVDAATANNLNTAFTAIGAATFGDGNTLPYANVNIANITANIVTVGQDVTYPYPTGGQGTTYFF